MTAISVSAPFPILTDIDGSPLDAGYVYIGQANLDPVAFPKSAYWDASLTTPAAQPIRTTGGYPARNGSPARIYTDGDYSIRINNKNGTLVYSSPAATDRMDSAFVGYDGGTVQDVLDAVTGPSGAASVGYMPAGTGAVATTVEKKLQETVSVFDFMTAAQIADVQAESLTIDVTSAIQAAVNFIVSNRPAGAAAQAKRLYFPPGKYLVNGTITLYSFVGMELCGASVGSTTIVRTSDTGNVFSVSVYLHLIVKSISFEHVTSSGNSLWSNSLFYMSGYGGGHFLQIEDSIIKKFATVINYYSGIEANEDTNVFYRLRVYDCKTFLYSRSNQAVINSVRNCTFVGSINKVFDISGYGQTHVDTCDVRISGKFFSIISGGTVSNYLLSNVKFEFWPQPGGTHQIVVCEGGATANFMFVNCSLEGGGPGASVEQFVLNLYSGSKLIFKGGSWASNIKIRLRRSITVTATTLSSNTYVKFSECITAPTPSNVTFDETSGTGQLFPAVIWENCKSIPNLCLTGSGAGNFINGAAPSALLENVNSFTGLNGSACLITGTFANVFSAKHYNQPAILQSVKIIVRSGLLNGAHFNVYADEARTTLIASVTPPNATVSSPVVFDVPIPANYVVSDGVYVEAYNTLGGSAQGRVVISTFSI